ncbi:MAG: hypothetical protein ACLFQ8_02895 [Candidatus Aenigmatarchaeota archaeon]
MKEKMLFFCILSIVLGLNLYFIFAATVSRILGFVFLIGGLLLSIPFFFYGILKDRGRESKSKRGWDRPFWKKVLDGK